jgi:glycosyltransferase involved in cell wall biosynthesis
MGPLSLLFISSDTYPPQRVDVRVLLGEELAGRGHRIDWILQSDGRTADRVVEWGGGTVWIGPTDLGTSLWRRVRKHVLSIVHDLRTVRRIASGDYQIVIVKDKFVSGIPALIAARIWRCRFVYWLSWPFPEDYLLRARDGTARYPLLYLVRGHAFRILLYRLLLPAADHVLAQSEQMKRDLEAHGVRGAKITAVPMGVSVASTGGAEPADVDARTILYLGTLIRLRRLDFLVRVLSLVKQRVPDARLVFVGSGDDPADEQLLTDQARSLGVSDSVVLTGQLPQAEAFGMVRRAAVCVSPFYPTPILNSTSPTKLVEYMALGKAVVANDHPEQKLVIAESNGGYCVAYDESAFADAIVELLKNPALAREMGRRGSAYVEGNRRYPAIANRVEAVLQTVVNGA